MAPRTHGTAQIHPTAEVSPQAQLGAGTKVWHQAQVREDAVIGEQCIIGKGAYVDFGVSIGAKTKIQNDVFIYHGVTIEDGVFLGPGVILTNDRLPRAMTPDGKQKSDADWRVTPTVVKQGASIGARAVILPGITIGEYAMVGAGAVVTRQVPAYALVFGNPARQRGYVCVCGATLASANNTNWYCPTCHAEYQFCVERMTVQPAVRTSVQPHTLTTIDHPASLSPTTK